MTGNYLFEGEIQVESGLIVVKDDLVVFRDDKLEDKDLFSEIHAGKMVVFGTGGDGKFGLKIKLIENFSEIDDLELHRVAKTQATIIEVKSGNLIVCDQEGEEDHVQEVRKFLCQPIFFLVVHHELPPDMKPKYLPKI